MFETTSSCTFGVETSNIPTESWWFEDDLQMPGSHALLSKHTNLDFHLKGYDSRLEYTNQRTAKWPIYR